MSTLNSKASGTSMRLRLKKANLTRCVVSLLIANFSRQEHYQAKGSCSKELEAGTVEAAEQLRGVWWSERLATGSN